MNGNVRCEMIKMNVSFPCSASAFVYIKPMITKLAVINLNWRYVAVFQNLPFIRFMTRGTKSVDEFDDPEGEEFKGPIPRDKLTISYVRGSGPGGQNVNKCKVSRKNYIKCIHCLSLCLFQVNTKVEVRMNLENADWISDRAKNRISKLVRTRLSLFHSHTPS